jgi:membrane-associated protease RseP (regulator of RpoE activity)
VQNSIRMSFPPDRPVSTVRPDEEPYILAEIVPTDQAEVVRTGEIPLTPILLFLACCVSTYFVAGWTYALAVMGILVCHEAGHYIQAKRYRVPASLPYFIPMPFSPIGTMGAVIAMRGHMGNRKALFDIGISGPLAGLVPTLICTYVGLSLSTVEPLPPHVRGVFQFNEPLLFRWLEHWFFGPIGENQIVRGHPLAIAGWVGMLITALNLIPIGQLDGGHILYAILRRRAHAVAWTLVFAALAGMILTQQYSWIVMVVLLLFMGPSHPPTADDETPIGIGRVILGWITLAFVIVGFTPTPFVIS